MPRPKNAGVNIEKRLLKAICLISTLMTPLLAEEVTMKPGLEEPSSDPRQALYFIHHKQYRQAVDHYRAHMRDRGSHDLQLLQEMGRLLLEEGSQATLGSNQLAFLFALRLSPLPEMTSSVLKCLDSPELPVQLAAIQLLGSFFDDRAQEGLFTSLSSPYLFVRLEAAYQLAIRKHKRLTGQL